jgi:alpha-galactosidase
MKRTRLLAFVLLNSLFLLPAYSQTNSLNNRWLSVLVRPQDGSFELRGEGLRAPVLVARIGAEVNHQWIWSTDYPKHQASISTFQDSLGSGHQLEITFTAADSKPVLKYTLQLYDDRPFGSVAAQLSNTTPGVITVQDIRVLDVISRPSVNLGAADSADRVLSDSYSEDRPPLEIMDLGKAHVYLGGDQFGNAYSDVHLGVGSQLIYNQKSKYSLLLAALTSDRWLTLLHLRTGHDPAGNASISSYAVDSTGTTEVMKKETLRDDPPSDQIELSLPVPPGQQMPSETLMFSVGQDYHAQLENYGEAIRLLHHARVASPAPWGWWSWTAYYFGLSQATALTNAQWLSAHLRDQGFNYFHVDEGYAYADGEFTTSNATMFPDGMRRLGHQVCRLGLNFALWIAPFRVSQRSWVYQHHPEWLVHNAQGKPIQIAFVQGKHDPLYVLDTTHPGAQEYLRQTYQVLTREWGARYFKLDFMDDTGIEGYHYKPDTTALESQQIGLKIIREAVGENVLLDKDGSPMLNTVGLTDEGRISTDTGHSFRGTKEDATGIAARYYMNRNFYVSDPDAFTVTGQLFAERSWHQSKTPLTLNDSQISIALAAVAGGMFEIGDDLPTLGATPDRLKLLENRDLQDMVRLQRAATPVDLMTYLPEDEQPSIFLLREDQRQAMLAVFNWTEAPRSHQFTAADLGFPEKAILTATDIFAPQREVALSGGELRLENEPPHSVRLIKIADTSLPARPPSVAVRVVDHTEMGAAASFSAADDGKGSPALQYHWDFGDGTSAQGPAATHAYTNAGSYTAHLAVDGLDGTAERRQFLIVVGGTPQSGFDERNYRRYQEPRP